MSRCTMNCPSGTNEVPVGLSWETLTVLVRTRPNQGCRHLKASDSDATKCSTGGKALGWGWPGVAGEIKALGLVVRSEVWFKFDVWR